MSEHEENTRLDATEEPEAVATYEDLASCVSLPLAAALLTEEAVHDGCREAKGLGLRGVLVRPSDLDLVTNWVKGSALKLGCVTGYPGGSSTTASRLYEAREVMRRGVAELTVTMNLGKLLSRKFLYLESELLQMAEQCRQNNVRLRVLIEVDHLTRDLVLIGIRLCKRTMVDSLDLLFTKGEGEFQLGVTRYVLHHAKGKLAVAVHAPEISLENALALRTEGASDLVCQNAPALMADWREELARQEAERKAKQAEQAAGRGAPLPPS